ncbi:MAG: hypothetical protein FWH14_01840 [Oscillospiraceae bacterium]|nr:hypothetical protein [Oscillospiraceae bacterium]
MKIKKKILSAVLSVVMLMNFISVGNAFFVLSADENPDLTVAMNYATNDEGINIADLDDLETAGGYLAVIVDYTVSYWVAPFDGKIDATKEYIKAADDILAAINTAAQGIINAEPDLPDYEPPAQPNPNDEKYLDNMTLLFSDITEWMTATQEYNAAYNKEVANAHQAANDAANGARQVRSDARDKHAELNPIKDQIDAVEDALDFITAVGAIKTDNFANIAALELELYAVTNLFSEFETLADSVKLLALPSRNTLVGKQTTLLAIQTTHTNFQNALTAFNATVENLMNTWENTETPMTIPIARGLIATAVARYDSAESALALVTEISEIANLYQNEIYRVALDDFIDFLAVVEQIAALPEVTAANLDTVEPLVEAARAACEDFGFEENSANPIDVYIFNIKALKDKEKEIEQLKDDAEAVTKFVADVNAIPLVNIADPNALDTLVITTIPGLIYQYNTIFNGNQKIVGANAYSELIDKQNTLTSFKTTYDNFIDSIGYFVSAIDTLKTTWNTGNISNINTAINTARTNYETVRNNPSVLAQRFNSDYMNNTFMTYRFNNVSRNFTALNDHIAALEVVQAIIEIPNDITHDNFALAETRVELANTAFNRLDSAQKLLVFNNSTKLIPDTTQIEKLRGELDALDQYNGYINTINDNLTLANITDAISAHTSALALVVGEENQLNEPFTETHRTTLTTLGTRIARIEKVKAAITELNKIGTHLGGTIDKTALEGLLTDAGFAVNGLTNNDVRALNDDDGDTYDNALEQLDHANTVLAAIEAMAKVSDIPDEYTVENFDKVANYRAWVDAAKAAKLAVDELESTYTGLWNKLDGGNVLTAAESYVTALEVRTVFTVTFRDAGGGIFDSVRVLNGDNVTAPTNPPTLIGREFLEWQFDGSEFSFDTPINSDITLTPEFTELTENNKRKVTVIGGIIGVGGDAKTSYTGDLWEQVNITADTTNHEGKVFSHWKRTGDDDDVVYTYTRNFYFTLTEDISLTAVYVDAEEEIVRVPQITLSNGGSENVVDRSVNPIMTIYIPEGYTIIERGYIGSYYSDVTTSVYHRDRDEMIDAFEDGAGKFAENRIAVNNIPVGESFTGTRQFTTSFSGIVANWDYQVMAYVKVVDSEGEETTIFSNLVRFEAYTPNPEG